MKRLVWDSGLYRNGQRGFTLIELLVVVAVIGILVGLLFPAFAHARRMAKKARAGVDVRQIEMAWKTILSDYRTWPSGQATGVDRDMDNAAIIYLRSGNSRGIAYMEFSSSSTNAGGFYMDPWGRASEVSALHAYRFRLGLGSVTPPQGTVYRDVAAWSKGEDAAEATQDDVKSWE